MHVCMSMCMYVFMVVVTSILMLKTCECQEVGHIISISVAMALQLR